MKNYKNIKYNVDHLSKSNIIYKIIFVNTLEYYIGKTETSGLARMYKAIDAAKNNRNKSKYTKRLKEALLNNEYIIIEILDTHKDKIILDNLETNYILKYKLKYGKKCLNKQKTRHGLISYSLGKIENW